MKKTTGEKKLESPVTLFAAIEASQHEFLRSVAFRERRSLADVVREALSEYQRRKERPIQSRTALRA